MAMTDKEIVDFVMSCRKEADEAKRERMSLNKENFDMFFLKHDFSHKTEGQSKEVLSRQQMAVIQNRNFYQQALSKQGDWWSAESCYPDADISLPVRAAEITKLTNYMLEQTGYFSHVGNCVQNAELSALAISKCVPTLISKPKYVSQKKGRGKNLKRWVEKIEDKTYRTKFQTVRAENFYPDPSGSNLYIIEDMWPDFHEVLAMATGDDAVYEASKVNSLSKGENDAEEASSKASETGQNATSSGHRPKVKLTEFWGTIINKSAELGLTT